MKTKTELTMSQQAVFNLVEAADCPYNTPEDRAKAEAMLRAIGAVDADGQFIRPNANPDYDEVFDLFM